MLKLIHTLFIFFAFPKNNIVFVSELKERRIHIYWTCLSFPITLYSQQTVCGINECKFFTPNVREVLEVIFCTNAILKKSFHNIIVKMSKLARLHGVKKKEVSGKLEVYDISLTWNELNKVWTNFRRKKIKFV